MMFRKKVKQLVAKYADAGKLSKANADYASLQKTSTMLVSNINLHHVNIGQHHCIDIDARELALVYKRIIGSKLHAVIGSIDAEHTIFEVCELTKCSFSQSRFQWTVFRDTSVKDTVFHGCYFYNVSLNGMLDSESAVFIGCRFLMCDLSRSKATFINCAISMSNADGIRIIDQVVDKADNMANVEKVIKEA